MTMMAPLASSRLWTCGYLFLLISLSLVHGQVPQLNGAHFRITGLEENGFLNAATNFSAPFNVTFSGYLKLMLDAIAKPSRANFTYTLLPPSGYGTSCEPKLDKNSTQQEAYDSQYRTQYNCGADDVNDLPLTNTSTDMYLGMYYVTPKRQLLNQFTIPFLPPFSGTLSMFGTATGIANFEELVEQQELGIHPAACAPAGTALIDFVRASYPGLQVKGIYGGEENILDAFQTGQCEIYIIDRPIAAQFVLRRFEANECMANGMPIGVIGEPMNFGLSHYAIGIRRDLPIEIERTLSYWLNVLMSCNPYDKNGPCPDGNLASFYAKSAGTGSECGYVLYPPSDALSPGVIAAIVIVSVIIVIVLYTLFHWYRLARQKRLYAKRSKAAMKTAQRERELNEFIAHEVRNPLSSAIAALNFVSSKASDPMLVPELDSRESIKRDIHVIDSSLQFVNELLRNMLDLHRSTDKKMKLNMEPTDILRDILEPVSSILVMRGAKVDVEMDCPQNLIVNADRMRLKQILLNLANNATKFVEQGYIRLRAEVVDGGDNVELYVEDSGPGIPVEKQQQLFAKFQDSLDVLNQGTGIGLCVCKNLSKLMDANLFLDSTFDSGVEGCPGARFTLRLNQAPLDIENGFGTLESDEVVNATRDLPEGLSVLFVDDDTMIRKMFSRTLSNVAPTWTIREASSGETALRIVDEDRFDIIFIDHYMASHTKQLLGTETASAFRSKGVDSIICGLSANDKEDEFLQAGANAFMLKPFPCKKDALKRELLRLLESREHAPSRHKNTNGNTVAESKRRPPLPVETAYFTDESASG